MSYVKVESVNKKYDNKAVLNNISFHMEKGEFVTLLGESGCGKSTLLRAIAGIIDIDKGSIFVNDHDITHLPSRKRGVGMVFQSYALFPNMTVEQNIAYGLKMKKEANIEEKVNEMIELMGLGGLEKRHPYQLSGGQQQRVALARSLILKPQILLLDEPLSALDAKIRKSLQEEIKRLQRELNITTIFVTHDQKEAMILSDTIYVMNDGVIVQKGSPEEIYTKPKNKFVASFIGSYNILTKKELQECVEEEIAVEASDIAIRTESITIHAADQVLSGQEKVYSAEGRIQLKTISGSLVSYQVEVKSKRIQVDELFQNEDHFKEGDMVILAIPRQACVPL